MSVKVENLEKNMAKLTIEVEASRFDKGLVETYQKAKSRIRVPGFRAGKVPMAIVEKLYGPEVFFEDTINLLLEETYPKAADESGISIVSRPVIDIVQASKGKPFIYTAEVAVKPEVVLGAYKGIEVEKAKVLVTDDEVEEKLKDELEKNTRVVEVDRVAANGDVVTIDFVGTIDGKEFEGGSGEDYPLTLGSGTFVPGFEDQLIGSGAGEELDVKIKFPEDYGASEVAGKDAVFHVSIKEVQERQVPEADDDFAQDVSEFDTLAEYKEDLRKTIHQQKEVEAITANENNVVKKVVENATMDLPEPMIEEQIDRLISEYRYRLQSQGISMENFLAMTGQKEDDVRAQMRDRAISNIKTTLVLEAVEKAEGLSVSEERLDEEIHKIADQYKMEYDNFVKTVSDSQKESIKRELNVQETIDFLVAEANLIDAPEDTENTEET